ncbi:MAG: site-specific tyrosine recombinase/integron integrase [Mediterraneibacter faecis]|nr:site-specific tyrosine recombinase/integron integrase [Mediterraneibacter faecis]
MREQFVNEFIATLSNQIPDDAIKTVFQKLTMFVANYNIEPMYTEIVPYTSYLPKCYEVYFVTRKIEGMSMKSLELYNMVLKDFFLQVNKPIEEINANDIRIYLYKVQEERQISNSTLDGRRTIIHSFLEWAANDGYVGSNPCRNIKPIKFEKPKRKPLTGIELEEIRNACENLKDKAIIEMFYSTGCRVTELERLNKSDVNFQTKEVYLFGKGDKHRTSYMNAKAEIAIKNYMDSRTDTNEALFVSDRKPHGRMKKEAIERRVRLIGEKSGIGRRLFPHLIRHTTATDGLERGMPIEEVQKILGHVNISTTMIYAEVSQQNVKNSHRKCIV